MPKDLVTDSLTDILTTFINSVDLLIIRFSLILSKITIVSFTEYPITVNIPTINIELTTEPTKRLININKPMTTNTSWTKVMIAAMAYKYAC